MTDEVEKLYDQLVAAGAKGVQFTRGDTPYGSSLSIPRAELGKLLALPGWGPDEASLRGLRAKDREP